MLSEDKCTGCSACEAICPVNAIIMKENQNGFLYPWIEREKCIVCGKCEKICPVNQKASDDNENIKNTYI